MKTSLRHGLDDPPWFGLTFGVSKVAEIKAAIDLLSPRERCELEALLHPWTDDDWDRQMADDAQPGGKLHNLMADSRKEAQAGKLMDFPSSHSE
jgi:hypothetical protein